MLDRDGWHNILMNGRYSSNEEKLRSPQYLSEEDIYTESAFATFYSVNISPTMLKNRRAKYTTSNI